MAEDTLAQKVENVNLMPPPIARRAQDPVEAVAEKNDAQADMPPPALPVRAKEHGGNSKEPLDGSKLTVSHQQSKTNGQHQVKGLPPYEEPSWAGIPEQANFQLETMKNGQIIDTFDLAKKSCFKFGRSPACDVVLEHPSASRLHAVIQFRGENGQPYLYDAGSVHGVFVNKRRIKPKVYAPLNVGDIIKLGQSSRLFIVSGPQELMPEEGMTKTQKLQLRALEAKAERQQREQEIAKAQMSAALSKGASWGMEEDSLEGDEDNAEAANVDWRAYCQTQSLTDKQQKLVDKLRRLERKIQNLTAEADKIKAKQGKMEEMTPGQAATLARNEQVIDTATDNLEELEEELNNSIAETLKGRKRNNPEANATRKRQRVDEDEVASDDDEQDDFYDRTKSNIEKKQKAAVVVHDAASLYGRKAALADECNSLLPKLKAEEEKTSVASDTKAAGKSQSNEDSLDAFMSDVKVELEHSKAEHLRNELASLQAEIRKLEGLLKHADPDGYYKEGTHAANVAKQKGLRLYNKDKEEEALRKRKKQEAADKLAREEAFVAEKEEEELIEEKGTGAAAQLPPPVPAATSTPEQPAIPKAPESSKEPKYGLNVKKTKDTSVLPPVMREADAHQSPQGTPRIANIKKQRPGPALKTEGKPEGSTAGESSILADLDLLRKANREQSDSKDAEDISWQQPQGQSGDGRTALNDKLGY